MTAEEKFIELTVGKTVVRAEYWEYGITLYFDDGSEINIRSRGTEENWLTVDEVDF